jgi:hypothetical protein
MIIAWASQEDYQLGQAFLKDLVGGSSGHRELHSDKLEFYYLETKQQLDALFDFRRALRAKRKGGIV